MAYLPSKLGPFELLRRLGAGGMAETFVAVRRGPGGFEQRVCIKRILPAYVSDQSFVASFLAEARTSAALRHTNIVQVLDFGLAPEDGSYYLALELVDGMDLRALAEQGGGFDAALVILVAAELAAALEHAHSADDGRTRVVHRDLSPSNVLVSRAGEIKLTDFGIARVVGGAPRTATGVIKGKVPYMPPEYIEGGRFDERGDLFALGVLVFELLDGERPFDGESVLDSLRRIVAGERRRFTAQAPTPLIQCIDRLLRTRADERFPSARALLDALPSIQVHATRKRLAEMVRARVPSAPRPTPDALAEAHALVREPVLAPRPAREPLLEAPHPSARAFEAVNPVARTLLAPSAPLSELAPALAGRSPRRDALAGPTRTSFSAPARGPSKLAILSLAGAAAVLFAVALAALLKLESGPAGAAALQPGSTPAPTPAFASPDVRREPETGGATRPEPEDEPSANAVQTAQDEGGSANEGGDSELEGPLPPPSLPLSTLREPPAHGAGPPLGKRAPRRAGRAHVEAGTSAQVAELRVVVVPFGDVWVDERYVGQSPLSLQLAPGTHELAVGEGRARGRRTIELTAGQHQELTLRLPPTKP